MKDKLLKLGNFVLDLLFPPVCLVCRRRLDIKENKSFYSQPVVSDSYKLPSRARGKPELTERSEGIPEGLPEASEDNLSIAETSAGEKRFNFLCSPCSQKIKINNTAFCPVCSRRLPENKKICHQESLFILAAAGFYGDETLDQLIAILKYQKIKQATVPLGEILSQYLNNLKTGGLEIENYVIVPVPLHWRKERQRGFNQANLIADCLSKNTGLPVSKNILKRIKNTASQVELKDKDKRETNILGCFEVTKPELVYGKNVILLDDVFTTGATMKEAALVIKQAGARKIIGLVVAKT